MVEELEPRVLFSADLIPVTTFDIGDSTEFEQDQDAQFMHNRDSSSHGATTDAGSADRHSGSVRLELDLAQNSEGSSSTVNEAQELDFDFESGDVVVAEYGTTTTELIIVDFRAQHLQTLVDEIYENSEGRINFEIVVLNADDNGIDVITEKVQQLENISAVHIISHGSDGNVFLGAQILNSETLQQHSNSFRSWESTLTDNADILIYGCDVAATQTGQAFIDALADVTGADVAASTDTTGHADLGGDWQFEYTIGSVEAELALNHSTQASYFATLATITVDTLLDVVDAGDGLTSLREAIITANSWTNPGLDTIILGSGTHELTISGSGNSGDLNINSDIELIGAADGSTIIEASAGLNDRVMFVQSGSSTISNVTITGGNTSVTLGGGGIALSSGVTLALDSVVVTGNSAPRGGGIGSDGFLTITNSTISNNTASGDGGGMRTGGGQLTVSNTTISGNSANEGGGIHLPTGSPHYFTNVTLSGNTAVDGGALKLNGGGVNVTFEHSTITNNTGTVGVGGILNQAGTVTIGNSIVAFNPGTSPNIDGPYQEFGNNLFSNDPFLSLSALADNGGDVQTHALDSGSSGIDGATGSIADDARGAPRDGSPDVGAFEFGATVPETVALSIDAEVSVTTNEDTARVLSGADAIIIDDGVTGDTPMRLSLDVSNGTLTLVGTAGITFVEGNNGDAAFVIEGLESDLIVALDTLTYLPNNDFNGSDALNSSLEIAANLEGHYTFDDGTANDTSAGATQDGALRNGATTVVDATRGTVLSLNNPGEHVEISGLMGQPANATLAAWVNLTTADTFGSEVLSIGDSLHLRLDAGGELQGTHHVGTYWDVTSYPVIVAGDGWHHVAYTFDDANNKQVLYLDGVAVAETNYTTSILYNLGSNTKIGVHGNSQSVYDNVGRIDDARIYTRALTDAEIAALAIDQHLVSKTTQLIVNPVNDPPVVGGFYETWLADETPLTQTNAVSFQENAAHQTAQITIDGQSYYHGIGIHPNGGTAVTEYALNGATSFTAVAGLNDHLISGGDVIFRAYVDGVEVFNSGVVTHSTPAISVSVDTTAGSTLRLEVDMNGVGAADHAVWADAMLTGGASLPTTISVAETAPNGTLAGTYLGSDPDVGDSLTYSLVSDALGRFGIDANTGVITVDDDSQLDFETIALHPITVRIDDGTTFTDHAVQIELTDVNEPPTGTDSTIVINEDAPHTFQDTDFGFVDPELDTLSFVHIASLPSGGTLTLNSSSVNLNAIISLADIPDLVYTPAADASGVGYDSFDFTVRDSRQQFADSTNTLTFNVNPVNDDPTNAGTLPSDVVVTEDVLSDVDLNLIDLSDVDAAGGDLTLTLTTANGDLSATSALGITMGGSSTALTLTGSQADLNTYLDAASNIQYLHGTQHSNGNDADTIEVAVNDNGNTGAGGGTDQGLGTVNVDITEVNDEQIIVANNTQLVLEGSTGYTITLAMLRASDVDNTNVELIYTVDAEPANGTLRMGGTALILNDTFTQDDIALGLISYDHDGSETSADSFDFTVDDGVGTTSSSTFNFIVANVNDAPVNTVPGAQTADEDTPLAITGVSVADSDDNLSTVKLSVSNGTLNVTLSGTAAISAGANGSNDLTLSGSLADINTALASLTYQGAFNFNGADTLAVLSTDSSAATDSDTVSITVNAVNDAPTFVGVSQVGAPFINEIHYDNVSTDQDETIEIAGVAGTDLTGWSLVLYNGATGLVNGSDALTGIITDQGDGIGTVVVNYPTNGLENGPDDGVALVDDTGAVVQLLSWEGVFTAIDGPAAGMTSIDVGVSEDGLTPLNTSMQLTDSGWVTEIAETFGAQNTGQDFSLLLQNYLPETVAEDSPLVFPTALGNVLAVDDIDANGAEVHMTLEVANGTITLGSTGGLNGLLGNGSSTIEFTGTIANINNALNGLTYQGNLNYFGPDVLKLTVDDQSNSGTGGSLTAQAEVNITVDAVNDEEVLAVNAGRTVAEGSTGNVIVATMLDTDDVDNFGVQLVYTIDAPTTNGTLYLNGTALGLNDTFTQADLNAGNVTYDHDDSQTASDSFDFTVDDGAGTDTSGTFIFTVTNVNDAPVNTVPVAQTVNEDTPLSVSGISVDDVDNNLSTVQLTVSNGTLNVSLSGTAAISAGANGSNDLTLSGSLADINTALASLTYQGSLNFNGADTLTVLSTDSNAATDSDTVGITIDAVNDEEVLAINTGRTVAEGSTGNVIVATMLDTDDVDNFGVQLVYTVDTPTVNGTLFLNGTALGLSDTFTQADINAGSVTYDHDDSQTASDSFDFTVDDGAGTDTSGTFIFTVTNVNDAPVNTVPVAQTVNEDTPLSVSGISVDDVDNNLSTVQLSVNNGTLNVSLSGTAAISAGVNGSNDLTLSGSLADINTALASLTYQGSLNFNGADTLTVLSTDSNAATDSDTVGITIDAVNDEEVLAINTGRTVAEGSTGNVIVATMLDTDDVDNFGVQLVYTVDAPTTNGTLFLNGTALGLNDTFTQADINTGSVTYDHDDSQTASDSFDFTVDDGAGTDTSGTFIFTVTNVNDAPVNTVPVAQTVNEDTPLSITGVSVDDVDNNLSTVQLTVNNGTLNVTLSGTAAISAGANGSNDLTLSGSLADINAALASLTYQGALNFNGADVLTVLSADSNAATDSDTVGITIDAVNDEQVLAINTGRTVAEGSTGNVIVATMLDTTDVDNFGVQLVYTVDAPTTNGTLFLNGTALGLNDTFTQADLNAGNVTYDHDDSQTSSDGFTFTVDDGAGTTTSDTFNFTVTNVNDAPVNTVPAAQTVDEDTPLSIAGVSVADVDNNLSTVQLTVNNGALNVLLSGTAAISAGVNGSNDLTLSGSLADINTALASLTYQGTLNFNGADTLTVLSTDSNAATDSDTVDITIDAVNDEEVLAINTGTTVAEGSAGNFITATMLDTTDIDNFGVQLVYTIDVPAANGTVFLNGTALGLSDTFTQADINAGSVAYDHDGSQTASDSFGFTVDDGAGAVTQSTFSIAVTNVNDAPVNTVPLGQSVNEDTLLAITGISVADADNNLSTVRLTVNSGTLNVSASGAATISAGANGSNDITLSGALADINTTLASLTYQGMTNFNGADILTVLSTDNDGATDTDTVSITIDAVNDEEVLAINAGRTVAEGSTGNVIVATMLDTTDVDNFGPQLVYTLDAPTSNGTLFLSGVAIGLNDTFTQADINAGSVTYDHDDSQTASDSFDFTVDDGAGTTTSDTFNFIVTNVNDAPVNTMPVAQTINEDTLLAINGISVDDVDNNLSTVRLTVNSGTLNVLLSGSAAILAGANGSNDLTLSGSLVDINTALASLTYQGALNFNGSDTLTVLSTDGDVVTDSDTVDITVDAVNDEEVLVTNAGITVAEGSIGNVIVAAMLDTADVDNFGPQLVYTLDAPTSNGTLFLSGGAIGLNDTFTQADINAGSVTYDHDDSQTASDSFDFTVDDGAGTATSNAFNFIVTNVNDAPVNAMPVAQTINEDTPLAITGISVDDVDNNLSTVQLSVSNGTLNVSLSGTAAVSAGSNGTNDLTLSGSLSDINIALANLTYQGVTNFNGMDTITVFSTDSDGATDVDSVSIAIDAVNDNPINAGALPGDVIVTEDVQSNVDLSLLDIFDEDIAGIDLTITLTTAPSGGDLSAATAPGIIIGGTSTSLTLSGSLVDLNAYLNVGSNVQYLHGTQHFEGNNADTITVVVNDNGNIGTGGGADQSLGIINVDITAVNDEEFLVANNGVTVAEGSVGNTITTLMLGASDVDNTSSQLIYTVENVTINGTLFLNGNVLGLNDTFSQADIDAGSVTYDHNGLQSTSDSFNFKVDDGAGTSTAGTFNFTVTNVNDAPVILGVESNAHAYLEGVAPIAISSSVTLEDVDDTHLESAAVVIAGNFVAGQDELIFSGQNGISGVYDAQTGVLLLTGNATLADYEAALRSVSYFNNSDDPVDFIRTVDYLVDDGDTTSNIASREINLIAINDSPVVVTLESAPLVYTENQPQIALTDIITVGDIDNTTLQGATVSIKANYSADQDNLLFTPTGTISGSFDASAGVLTLSGTATVAEYQSAVRSVSYFNSSDNPSTATRTIAFSFDDGALESAESVRSLIVQSVNDAPVASDNTVNLLEDSAYVLMPVDFGFTDLEQHSFESIVVQSLPVLGTLYVDGVQAMVGQTILANDIAAGKLVFIPESNTNAQGYGDFEFNVVDDGGTALAGVNTSQNPNQINFNVDRVHDAPSGTDKLISLAEDTSYEFTASDFGFTDAFDNDQFIGITATTVPDSGVLALNGVSVQSGDFVSIDDISAGFLQYTPAQNVNGVGYTGFLFQVRDNGSAANSGEIIDLTPNNISFDLLEVNDPPVLVTEVASVGEGDRILLTTETLMAVDPDNPPPSELSFTINSLPSNGVLTLNGVAIGVGSTFTLEQVQQDQLLYIHDGSETTSDFFDIQLSDGAADGSQPVTGRLNLIVDSDGLLPPIGGAIEVPNNVEPDYSGSEESELEVLEIEEVVGEEGAGTIDALIDTTSNSVDLFASLDNSSSSNAGIVIETATYDYDLGEPRYLIDTRLAKLGIKHHNTVFYADLQNEALNLSSASLDLLQDIQRNSSYKIVANKNFIDGLRRLDSDLGNSEEESNRRYQVASDAAVGVSISVTAGILAWVLRGGALFASLMTSTPLWNSIDPVKVIGGSRSDEDESDEPEGEVEDYFS